MQALTRNKATIRTCQKYKASHNLTRLSGPSHRRSELLLRLVIHRRRKKRRLNRPRTNSIYSDPFLDLLIRKCSSESYNGALGGGVIEEIWASYVRVYAGAGDDYVAAGHLREDVFGEEEKGWMFVAKVSTHCSL
jgi:hypothetical protein